MWIIVALVADLCLYLFAGQDIALDFLGGYLIELSLSVDNLFVFLTIFTSPMAVGSTMVTALELFFLSLCMAWIISFTELFSGKRVGSLSSVKSLF